MNKLLQFPKATAFFCGWISILALPPMHIFPILFISFSLLLYLINQSPSAYEAYKRGYYFGFAFFAFGFSWIGNALLIDATFLVWLYPLVLLACGLFFGLFIAIPSCLSYYFKKPFLQYLSFCSIMVLFEWIRSFFLTGFPWNLWGTVFAFDNNLIQLSSIGGTYLLSLLALLISGSFFIWLSNIDKKHFIFALSISIALLSSSYLFGYLRLKDEQKKPSSTLVRVVQPSIPQTLKWGSLSDLEQNLYSYIDLSSQKPLDKINAVIWGETASPFLLNQEKFYNSKVQKAIPQKGYLITGQLRLSHKNNTRQLYNSMMVYNSEGKLVASYDKSHLVPFGEYIPFRQYLPSWLRPLANTIGTFSSGKGAETISLSNLPDLGAIICYEAIFPHKIITKQNRPQWIINPTNDGWYGDSFGPHQHFTTTRLRAVEEGITIVRAANNGISAVISPYGTILKKLELNQKSFIDVYLPKKMSFSTIYSTYGNNIILVFCILILFACLYIRTRTKP